MTEKEKCRNGEIYDANNDAELLAEREVCAGKIFNLNSLHPSLTEQRNEIIRNILGSTNGKFTIISPFFCDYGYNIMIGKNFFANTNCVILDEASVRFGDNVFIGPNCSFYTAGHPLNVEQRNQGLEYAKPITVGDNVWIGGNVCVVPGVTIGNNCVIGAGSVVTHNIPDNSLAVGNPCKVIKQI